jgi:hypothetical protein
MRKLSFLFISIVIYLPTLTAQIIEWQKSFGGSDSDVPFCIRQTHDRSYVIAGYSSSNNIDVTGNHGFADYWIVKLDSLGTMQWEKSFGGSEDDIARSVEKTKDGGYIVAGYTHSDDGDITINHGVYDYWIIKLDSMGSLVWQKTYGGSSNDKAHCAKPTTDGGYIIAGYAGSTDGDVTNNHGNYDYWIIKLDSTGSLQWQKSLGGSGDDEAFSIQQTFDGGFITTGASISNNGDVSGNHGSYDYWIIKLNALGILQWQKTFGGTNMDIAYSVNQTTDKGYIIAGTTKSSDGDVTGFHGGITDFWIIKLDSTGSLQWQRTLGGSDDEGASCIEQTKDNGYIIAGGTSSNDGDVTGNHGGAEDYWIVKLDLLGNMQWQKTLGGSNQDGAGSIQQTIDGNYIIAGGTESSNGDVTVNYGFYDYWIVKLSADVGIEDYHTNYSINIYPNPTSGKNNICVPQQFGKTRKLELFDCTGQLQFVQTDNFPDIDISSMTSGFYFIVLTNFDNERLTSKIIKE